MLYIFRWHCAAVSQHCWFTRKFLVQSYRFTGLFWVEFAYFCCACGFFKVFWFPSTAKKQALQISSTGYSKLPIDVNVSVNAHLSLCLIRDSLLTCSGLAPTSPQCLKQIRSVDKGYSVYRILLSCLFIYLFTYLSHCS